MLDKIARFMEVENLMLKSRYLLLPMLFALLLLILKITVDFVMLLAGMNEAVNISEHTVQALELLDIAMIANLIWLISAGSFYVFVYTEPADGVPMKKRPRCLTHISSGILKEKLAGSLMGVVSVYLLKIFFKIAEDKEVVNMHKTAAVIGIYVAFMMGLLAFNHSNASVHHQHNPEK